MHSHRPRSLPPVALETLADRAGATVVGGGSAQGVLVTGVSLDSRTVRPGDLYAALPGAHAHGATFVAGAVAAGAVAVLTDPEGAPLAAIGLGVPILLVEAPRAVLGDLAALVYGHPADAMRLIGVTGTNGKTTTAYLIESALRGLGARTGLIGTVETRVGDERLTSRRTTPEAPDLHAILAVMREAGTDSVVMAVSYTHLDVYKRQSLRCAVVSSTPRGPSWPRASSGARSPSTRTPSPPTSGSSRGSGSRWASSARPSAWHPCWG